MRKRVFGHLRKAKAQIRLRICAVWSGSLLYANRITGYYRMYEWRTKARMILCTWSGWSESAHIAHVMLKITFSLDTVKFVFFFFKLQLIGRLGITVYTQANLAVQQVSDLPELTHCMLGKNSADDSLNFFSYFSCDRIEFDNSWKLSPKDANYMKVRSYFLGKNKKKGVTLLKIGASNEYPQQTSSSRNKRNITEPSI